MKSPNFEITTFYRFQAVANPEVMKDQLFEKAKELDLIGLVILGEEGFNATVAAPSVESMTHFKSWVQNLLGGEALFFKNSKAPFPPFRRFQVKIREEIVTLGTPELKPEEAQHKHLSPEEWTRVMQEEDVLIIDTRNWYEYKLGTFKGAINPNTDQFSEFPKFIQDKGFSKDQKTLIFCTGGIRCERGILELERQGYNNVYQLDGGILNYLEKQPNKEFEGECFVFDHRVAVDQNLNPSQKYYLCPHCGQPGETLITCVRCDSKEHICETCHPQPVIGETCSKHCAGHWRMFPGKKGAKQALNYSPRG